MIKKIELDILTVARLNKRLELLKNNTGCQSLDLNFLLCMMLDFISDIEGCSSSIKAMQVFSNINEKLGDHDRI